MQKDLLNFLFHESFQPDNEDVMDAIFEKMEEIEDLEAKQGPLQKAVKALGFDGKVIINPEGTADLLVDDHTVYLALVAALQTGDALCKLAELGWVPAFNGDDQPALENPVYRVSFITITEPTPSDGDKVVDLEKMFKELEGPELELKPKGIGSDLKPGKIPDGKKSDINPTPPKNPKPIVRDSLSEGKSDQTLENDANFVVKALQKAGLVDDVMSEDDAGATQKLLIYFGAEEEDTLPGFWNLFSNMEHGDMEKIAARVLDKLSK